MNTKIRVAILLLTSLLVGCSNHNTANIEKTIKYRERNAVSSISLDNIKGNVRIIGWGEDFIEINTTKRLMFGLQSDLNLFDTVFFRDNSNELIIRAKIPARLNARIDLVIYVPFVLSEISISQEVGNISVEKYLGSLNITSESGSHRIEFMGQMLRMNCSKSHVDLDIVGYRPADIVLSGDGGEYNMRIAKVVGQTYIDVSGHQTNVGINISDQISHSLFLKSNEKRIHLRYKPDDMQIFSGTNMAIRGSVGDTPQDCIIDVNANGGRIIMQRGKNMSHSVDMTQEIK